MIVGDFVFCDCCDFGDFLVVGDFVFVVMLMILVIFCDFCGFGDLWWFL